MVSIKKKKTIIRWIFIILAMILGGLILGVSLIRTSLNTVLKEENENELRTEPVEFLISKEDGNLEKLSYKLPSANILPTSIFYPLKKIRENLWIKFINDPLNKSKINLLIADKRMTESIILMQHSKIEKSFETIQEAIDKLKYSEETIKGYKGNVIKTNQLKEQIFKAGLAYKSILESNQQFFKKTTTDNEKYKKMFEEIDSWNQTQAEERKAQKK